MTTNAKIIHSQIYQKVECQHALKRKKTELTAAMAQAPNNRQLSSEAGGEKTKPKRSLGLLPDGIWTHNVVHQIKMGDSINPYLGWWVHMNCRRS